MVIAQGEFRLSKAGGLAETIDFELDAPASVQVCVNLDDISCVRIYILPGCGPLDPDKRSRKCTSPGRCCATRQLPEGRHCAVIRACDSNVIASGTYTVEV